MSLLAMEEWAFRMMIISMSKSQNVNDEYRLNVNVQLSWAIWTNFSIMKWAVSYIDNEKYY